MIKEQNEIPIEQADPILLLAISIQKQFENIISSDFNLQQWIINHSDRFEYNRDINCYIITLDARTNNNSDGLNIHMKVAMAFPVNIFSMLAPNIKGKY